MKKTIFNSALIVLVALTVASFTTLSEKAVSIKDSKITWKAYKVTGQHEGTINLKDGNLTFTDSQLTGGHFVIDMPSINVTDLEGNMKGKLEGHLKSDDFFGVENHPTASFKITKVEGKGSNVKVIGDLTIKGITITNTFDMELSENTATAALKIDRTKFDIKYGSATFIDGIKDKAIYDEFDLNVTLKF